jgi:hypothetical protein
MNTEPSLSSHVQGKFRAKSPARPPQADNLLTIETETKISKLDLSSRILTDKGSISDPKSPKGGAFQLACDDEDLLAVKERVEGLEGGRGDGVDDITILKNKNDGEGEKGGDDDDSDGDDEFDVLKNFMADELSYKLDQKTIERNQTEIKWKMRAILYDWMSEVCNDYMFKRDTYCSAVKLVDLFLQKYPNVKKSEFQLVGLCAIFISMKMLEIVAICAEDLLYCTSNVFNLKELLLMEKKIINACEWKINPMTLNHWLNLLTSNWDLFATCLGSYMTLPQNCVYIFRETEKKSYLMHRELCQLIDACILVPETLQYNGGLLIAAF